MQREHEAVAAGLSRLTRQEFIDESLRLMGVLDSLCHEHGWRYALTCSALKQAAIGQPRDGDSLIGDIDVVMPRADYEALIHCTDELDRCHLLDVDADDYPWMYGKLSSDTTWYLKGLAVIPQEMGVFIDIFPLDAVPDDPRSAARFARRCWSMTRCFRNDFLPSRTLRQQVGHVLRTLAAIPYGYPAFGSPSRKRSFLHDYLRRHNNPSTDEAQLLCSLSIHALRPFDPCACVSSAEFDNLTSVNLFGMALPSFADPQAYLRGIYGDDWNKPKQTTRCDIPAFWRPDIQNGAIPNQ